MVLAVVLAGTAGFESPKMKGEGPSGSAVISTCGRRGADVGGIAVDCSVIECQAVTSAVCLGNGRCPYLG